MFAFAAYVTSASAENDADSASPFLRLLIHREERDSGSVAGIYARLAPAVAQVASRQTWYAAAPNIDGNFREMKEALERLCGWEPLPRSAS